MVVNECIIILVFSVFNESSLPEWTTQTTSGELLNRFLDEAEQAHKIDESPMSNSIWPSREVTPICQPPPAPMPMPKLTQVQVPLVQPVKSIPQSKPVVPKVKASSLLRSVFKVRVNSFLIILFTSFEFKFIFLAKKAQNPASSWTPFGCPCPQRECLGYEGLGRSQPSQTRNDDLDSQSWICEVGGQTRSADSSEDD